MKILKSSNFTYTYAGLYKLVTEPKSWNDAKQHCQGLKASLVTIATQLQNDDLMKKMKAR